MNVTIRKPMSRAQYRAPPMSVTWTPAGEYSDIRYETSGDVSGDFTRVVGYAGLVVAAAPAELQ